MADPAADFGVKRSGGGSSPASDFGVTAAHGKKKETKKNGGRGFFGTIAHLPGATAKDLYHIAVNTPAGVAALGKAEYSAVKSTVQHPWISKEKAKEVWSHPLRPVEGTANTPEITAFGQANVKSAEETLHHPLRHPGQTLLYALPVASGLAKAGIAAKAGATGTAAAETRTLAVGDLKVHPELSRSGIGQVSQLAYDKALTKAAARKPGGRAETKLHKKIGKTLTAETRMREQIAKGPAQALQSLGRKLSPGEQKALQVVAEEAPLKGRITAASARVTGARTPEARARHQVELDLLHQAQPHLTERGGLPSFTNAKLKGTYAKMAKVAGDRETLLKELGLLTDEAVQSRTTAAGRVALGARYIPRSEARTAARAVRDAATPGLAAETKAARAEVRAAKKTARELDVQATRAENEAYRTGTQRTAAEQQALSATAKANRAAATASAQRATHAERAIRGERLAGLISREQRLAQISWERFQRGEIGEGALARSHTRLGNLLDSYERDAGSVTKMRAATRTGTKAVAEQEATLQRLRAAEKEATGIHERAKSAAQAVRGNASRATYYTELTKRVGEAGVGKRRAEIARAMQEQLNRADRIMGAEHFTASPNAVRIPDVATRKGSALAASGKVGTQGTVGHLKAPGSTTHAYSGVLREHAVRRQDTTALVAESSLEAAQYAGLKHLHTQVRKAVSAEPRRPDDLAVRLDNLGTSEKMPLQARKFLTDPEEFFKTATPAEAGSVFDKIKAHTFIDTKTMTPEDRAAFAKLQADGKIGWVPRKMLGNLAKPSAPLAASAGKGVVSGWDALNNAQRSAILYLKPAYAVPNILGNAALNIIQQGFAAPKNLAIAARMQRRLGPEIAGRIDAAMGEGFALSISSHGSGVASGVVDKAARFWSKGVDVPFRRASFLHEAHRAGYRTPKELETLLVDSRHIDKLTDVSIKANREIIDYANLSPVEREIVRRVVFFYPWVKGSTVYTGRILREHPVASAVLGTLGARGSEQYQRDFPGAPSYFEGSIKAGNRVINPAAASIFGTPAQVGRAGADLLTGRISDAGRSGGFMTPALSLEEAVRTHRDPGSDYQYPAGTPPWAIAQDQLVSGLPQASLYQNLRGQSRSANPLYPPSAEVGAGRFLLGGLYPRKYDPWQLRQRGLKEKQRLGG